MTAYTTSQDEHHKCAVRCFRDLWFNGCKLPWEGEKMNEGSFYFFISFKITFMT